MDKWIFVYTSVVVVALVWVYYEIYKLCKHVDRVCSAVKELYTKVDRTKDDVWYLRMELSNYIAHKVRAEKKEERDIKNAHVMRVKKELDNMLNHIPKNLYEYCGRECSLGQYRHKYIIKCDCRAQLIADVRSIICDRGVEWSECYTPKDNEFVVSIYEVD